MELDNHTFYGSLVLLLFIVIALAFAYRLSDHRDILRDSRPEGIRHITNMNSESKINITYLRDPKVDLCYALILGTLPDNDFIYTVKGVVPVSCEKIPDDLFVGNISKDN